MWKDFTIVNEEAIGINIILDNLPEFLQFYLSQTKAENHAVREASCLVIQELIIKVAQPNPLKFTSYVSTILLHLLECFKDMSWPVRDSACISCANVFQL